MSTETSILDLILRIRKAGGGTKETEEDLDKLKKKTEESNSAFGGMVKGLADVKAGFDMVGQVMGMAQQAFDATVAKAANWGDEMGDLAQLTGTSVRDTSELAATMELLGISTDNMTKVVKAMTAQGLQPTMANLRQLAEQYQAIQDPVQKNEFLFKRFGKQAGDIAEILGKSTEELDQFTAAARRSGKVIDDETSAAGERLNVQIAMLQQRVEGASIALGNVLIPTLNTAMTAFDQLTQIWQYAGIELAKNVGLIDQTTASAAEMTAFGIQPATAAADTLTVSISEATATNKDMADSQDLVAEAAERQRIAHENNVNAADRLKASFGELTNQMIFNQAAASLDADGQLELARQLGLVNETTYGAISAAQDLKAKYDLNHDGAISAAEGAADYIAQLAKLKDTIDSLQDKVVTVQVVTQGDIGQVITNGIGGNQLTTRRAAGGSFNAGGAVFFNESPATRPEVIVASPAGGGYVMTRQDAERAMTNNVTNNYYLNVSSSSSSLGVSSDFALMKALGGV